MQATAQRDEERPRLELSVTTVSAGVIASVASAVLGSTLGVAGTILGAAIGAVVYSLASTLYQHSVAAARFRLRARVEHQNAGLAPGSVGSGGTAAGCASGDPAVGCSAGDAAETAALDAAESAGPNTGETTGPDAAEAARPDAADTRARLASQGATRKQPARWHGVLAGSLGSACAFALALLLVTGVESAKGAPLGGGQQGGLTVLGGASIDRPDPDRPDGQQTDPADGDVHMTTIYISTSTTMSTSTVVATSTRMIEPTSQPGSGTSAPPVTDPAESSRPEQTTSPEPTSSGPAATGTTSSAPAEPTTRSTSPSTSQVLPPASDEALPTGTATGVGTLVP